MREGQKRSGKRQKGGRYRRPGVDRPSGEAQAGCMLSQRQVAAWLGDATGTAEGKSSEREEGMENGKKNSSVQKEGGGIRLGNQSGEGDPQSILLLACFSTGKKGGRAGKQGRVKASKDWI